MGTSIFETSNQLWVFLYTMYGGAVLGLLFDLLTIIRQFLRGKRVLTVFFDLLYWVLATALAFVLLYYACQGEFRYFHLLGFALGAALWFWGPGKAVKWVHMKIRQGCRLLWSKFKATPVYGFLFK